jgi:hypothetical protein
MVKNTLKFDFRTLIRDVFCTFTAPKSLKTNDV